jgi:hypothetical protein
MATMALPIRELELSVCVGTDKARAETECVAFYSRARAISPGINLTIKLSLTAALLRWLLRRLVNSQRMLIKAYQRIDFTHCTDEEIAKIAKFLAGLVERGQAILAMLDTLGPRAHAWFGPSMSQLREQLEHLDSIAESLHLAIDDEATALLAMAVEEFSTVSALVMQ